MKRFIQHFFLLSIGLILISSVSFGLGSQMTIKKAYDDLEKDKGNDCYVIGKFPLTHLMDQTVANPDIASGARDINSNCTFDIRIELINVENNKVYLINPKPVTGSYGGYYHNDKLLAQNSDDPFWVMKIPVGDYQIRDFICSLILRLPGYQDFRAAVVEAPVTKIVKKSISFSSQPKQIIYLGDYDMTFTTFICLNAGTQLYTFNNIKVNLENNFEAVKTDFLNGADEKLKEKLNGYEFISVLK
jgi:hypothetical protein